MKFLKIRNWVFSTGWQIRIKINHRKKIWVSIHCGRGKTSTNYSLGSRAPSISLHIMHKARVWIKAQKAIPDGSAKAGRRPKIEGTANPATNPFTNACRREIADASSESESFALTASDVSQLSHRGLSDLNCSFAGSLPCEDLHGRLSLQQDDEIDYNSVSRSSCRSER